MLHELDIMGDQASSEINQTDDHSLSDPHVDEAGKVLLTLVELNLLVLREEDHSSHIQTLIDSLSIHHIMSHYIQNIELRGYENEKHALCVTLIKPTLKSCQL